MLSYYVTNNYKLENLKFTSCLIGSKLGGLIFLAGEKKCPTITVTCF